MTTRQIDDAGGEVNASEQDAEPDAAQAEEVARTEPAAGADADRERTDASASTDTGIGRRRRRLIHGLALVICLAVLASGLVAWHQAATDASLARAHARHQVVIAATGAIETMNSMDYRHVKQGLQDWASVTTGTLHDQIAHVTDKEQELLASQHKIAEGDVVDLAVTRLSDGSATVIAAVEVSVRSKPDGEPSVKRNRFRAELLKVDGEWLIEHLQQVGVKL